MKIAVLMSTYNGENYIAEQIDSILNQKLVNGEVKLYIRDDGSTDSTVKIIEQYASEHENIIFANRGKIENVGIQKSFLSLLQTAYKDGGCDYYSFADQDDVWLEDKLSAALKLISEINVGSKGVLYYSNKTFTDDKLNTIREEDIRYYDDVFEAFWKNLASGCTMVFDNTLTEICLRHMPETTILHDSWIYHVAKLIDSQIVFDKKSYILYRQHGDNNVGIEGAKLYHSDISYMLKRMIPVLFIKRKHSKQKYIEEVYNNYSNMMSDNNKKLAQDMVNYRFNPAAKFRLIHNQYMKKRDQKSKAVWIYSMIFNRI